MRKAWLDLVVVLAKGSWDYWRGNQDVEGISHLITEISGRSCVITVRENHKEPGVKVRQKLDGPCSWVVWLGYSWAVGDDMMWWHVFQNWRVSKGQKGLKLPWETKTMPTNLHSREDSGRKNSQYVKGLPVRQCLKQAAYRFLLEWGWQGQFREEADDICGFADDGAELGGHLGIFTIIIIYCFSKVQIELNVPVFYLSVLRRYAWRQCKGTFPVSLVISAWKRRDIPP